MRANRSHWPVEMILVPSTFNAGTSDHAPPLLTSKDSWLTRLSRSEIMVSFTSVLPFFRSGDDAPQDLAEHAGQLRCEPSRVLRLGSETAGRLLPPQPPVSRMAPLP